MLRGASPEAAIRLQARPPLLPPGARCAGGPPALWELPAATEGLGRRSWRAAVQQPRAAASLLLGPNVRGGTGRAGHGAQQYVQRWGSGIIAWSARRRMPLGGGRWCGAHQLQHIHSGRCGAGLWRTGIAAAVVRLSALMLL